MINKWILNNFKSINQEKELHFRPLTIFTGANSSGKSTILQSILLVTQTLQDQIESRSIVLNGWFKKFGTYSDIVFHREDERNIEIGFEIEDDDNYSLDYLRFTRVHSDIDNAECRFVISSEGKKESLYPILKELKISSHGGGTGHKATELTVVHNPDRTEKELEVIEQCKSVDSDDNYFDYKAIIRGTSVQFVYTDSRKWKPIGCSLSHFLPENIVRYNTEKEYIDSGSDSGSSDSGSSDSGSDGSGSDNGSDSGSGETESIFIGTSVNDDSMGSVTGMGTYTKGETVTLTATANAGYRFVKWGDDVTDNPRTVTADTNGATYSAVFEAEV